MIHRCESCPGISQVEAYLKEQLLDNENESTMHSNDTDNPDYDEEEEAITQTLSVTEYISKLCN